MEYTTDCYCDEGQRCENHDTEAEAEFWHAAHGLVRHSYTQADLEDAYGIGNYKAVQW